jgi:two-component system osmolarity sensor histidine kinase EnvZ
MQDQDISPGEQADEADGLDSRIFKRGDSYVRAVRGLLRSIMPTPVLKGWSLTGRLFSSILPKGLLGRSLLIIVAPMLILLMVLTSVFMDRHWALVTARLSDGMVRNIAALVDLIERQPPGADLSSITEIARNRMKIRMRVLPAGELGPDNRSYLGLLDTTLSSALRGQIKRPFSLDVGERTSNIEIRVPIDRGTLRVVFPRNLAYAANWHFFLVWMGGVGLGLVVVSVVFIRNQIKPIQRLANAAEAFGKGRPVGSFAPQGAREVRRAALAFIEMRRRIERQLEQRTTMLAGVSHDLRTVLTRFRLELALLPDGEETEDMRRDIDEMEAMLEAYVAFAKGDADEGSEPVDVEAAIADVATRTATVDVAVSTVFQGPPLVSLRPGAFRRLVGNLVGNAVRYGRSQVEVAAEHRDGWLSLRVDDDGPGIPEAEREAVFRPFYRLDIARNQDIPGTGLGLAIARDVARSHGGDVRLENSPLGGLRAVVRLPG